MPENNQNSHWTVDRRVPVAIIGAIILQSLTAVWWAASLSSQVNSSQARIETLEHLATQAIQQSVTIARLEEKMNAVNDKLNSVQEVSRVIRSAVERTDTVTQQNETRQRDEGSKKRGKDK